jgi:hypothetical protein
MDTTKSMRVSTRSPVALARKALEVAADAVPAYSCKYSRKDFTQHQLLAVLALEQFLNTDDRGVIALLADWSDLREALGLRPDKLPHHTTLFRARERLAKKGASSACCARSSAMLRPRGGSASGPRRRSIRRGWRPASARPTTPAAAATAIGATATASSPS